MSDAFTYSLGPDCGANGRERQRQTPRRTGAVADYSKRLGVRWWINTFTTSMTVSPDNRTVSGAPGTCSPPPPCLSCSRIPEYSRPTMGGTGVGPSLLPFPWPAAGCGTQSRPKTGPSSRNGTCKDHECFSPLPHPHRRGWRPLGRLFYGHIGRASSMRVRARFDRFSLQVHSRVNVF